MHERVPLAPSPLFFWMLLSAIQLSLRGCSFQHTLSYTLSYFRLSLQSHDALTSWRITSSIPTSLSPSRQSLKFSREGYCVWHALIVLDNSLWSLVCCKKQRQSYWILEAIVLHPGWRLDKVLGCLHSEQLLQDWQGSSISSDVNAKPLASVASYKTKRPASS